MGLGAELLEDFRYEAEHAECINNDTGIWITRKGVRIPYSKLEDSHLRNIIHMLQRNEEDVPLEMWIEVFERWKIIL